MMYKIAQVADMHISSEFEVKYDLNIKKRFINVLDEIVDNGINFVILTGDLAYSGDDINAYYWMRRELEKRNLDFAVLPGNHDDSIRLAKAFNCTELLEERELFYSRHAGEFRLVFLDSSREYISEGQLDKLERVADETESDIAIFVHHPLDYCDCRFMDRKYPLKNIPEVKRLIAGHKNIKYIFTGHYHTEKIVAVEHATQYLTPSTWYQIDGDKEDFNICPEYGWREIMIDDNQLTTSVHYFRAK